MGYEEGPSAAQQSYLTFTLGRYRSTTNVNLPFKVHPIVEEIGKSRVEYNISLRANFDSKLSGNNIVLRIPTPPNTTNVKCQVVMGKAKYVPEENMIIWKWVSLYFMLSPN